MQKEVQMSNQPEFQTLSIKEICDRLHDDGLTHEQIGNLIGVSRLQVKNYIDEKTKEPRPQVSFNIWDNVILDGKKVVTDNYLNPEHLAMTRQMIEKAK